MSKLVEMREFFKRYPETWAYRVIPKAIRKELYSRPDRVHERQRYWKQVEELESNLASYWEEFATIVQACDIARAKLLAGSMINKQETITSGDTEFQRADTIRFEQMCLKNPEEGGNEFQLQYTTGSIEHIIRDRSSDEPYFVLRPEEHNVQGITISFILDGRFKVTGVNRRDNAPYPYRQEYHKEIYFGDLTLEDKSQDSGNTFSRYPIRFDSLEQVIGLVQGSTLPISNKKLDRKEGSVYLVNKALISEIK